jgi:hypothetical protein
LTTANPPLPKFGQGVIQGGLKTLLFHLKDIHTLILKIEEDIEFQRGLTIKEIPGNL